MAFQHIGEPLSGVHGAGVDPCERFLPREATLPRAEPELVAEQVHHVGRVGLVEHRERGIEAEGPSVQAQQPVGDGVERAAHMREASTPTSCSPAMRSALDVISRAARRLNVSNNSRSGRTPRVSSHATREASVVVLPVPAPATISNGPSPVTASRCVLAQRIPEHVFEDATPGGTGRADLPPSAFDVTPAGMAATMRP